ncbi:uncharacterized protein LOC9640265 isoform X2 [Selaginella moellendorffii]|uniref:uncharacterized protein LOC9640265 isoform X2 n=1 Tax=Selaginella moellendorffii TaxID=88036 RepID=UPI000D1C46BD|nr:uncharacterized protein LOC9640265 isoform X2 [Selaginella moellendorffii]|eukprot:XP_024532314.1 uncharacterized protein LOC9640265 isoform X2 [Selaginella moellendorffii]
MVGQIEQVAMSDVAIEHNIASKLGGKGGGGCCCCCCGDGNRNSPCKTSRPTAVASAPRIIPDEKSRQVSEASTSSSNLDQFLHHTTPKVQLQCLPKTCLWDSSVKRWRPANVESIPFFTLGDLWDSFDEWSAYGAGVPLVLNGKEEVVQYYVPYLSALQLYTRTGLRRCLNSRKFCHDSSDASESSDYRDSNSDVSSDNDSESSVEGIGPIRTSFWKKCQTTGFCRGRSNATLSALHEVLSDDDDEEVDNWERKEADHLLLSYLEDSAPYSRVPLIGKISELERSFPDIRTLRSYELLPTSWFSIAWYPIYRIPTGPTLKDLGTCFLTFHSLSTPLQEISDAPEPPLGSARLDLVDGSIRPEDGLKRLVLQSFGLGSYKLRGAFWTSAGNPEKLLASNLEGHADSWLKGLRVRHPDFEFFASRSPNRR